MGATTDEQGLLTIDRAYSRLAVAGIPCLYKEIIIALRVCSTSAEDGIHSFQLSVTDLDRKVVSPSGEDRFETKTVGNQQYTWMHEWFASPIFRSTNQTIFS